MAEVGIAFLSPFLGVVFDKMASPGVVDFISRQKSTEKLLAKMKISLLSMNKVLEDAEEKEVTDPNVKMWNDELKDVAYTAEDILDEIATKALQRQLREEYKPAIVGKVRNFISGTSLDPFIHYIEPKIKEVLDRLEHLAEQKDFMGLQAVGVGGKQYPERSTTSYVRESDIFGRDEDKKKVIDLLIPSDARDNEMCVIAIVGMGGVGKTTLAQLVYNDNSSIEQHFDHKIWVCVSKFDEHKIKKSIIAQAKKSIKDQAATSSPRKIDEVKDGLKRKQSRKEVATSSAGKTEDPEQLEVLLKESLNGKKFLLALDDVWSDKPIHREFLDQLLQYGAPGSKILITTRNESVASAMHAIRPYHLNLLPNDDCWSLFEKHAFRDGSSNADPKIEIGKQIVQKCEGLPLAIKAIGDLLWSESNAQRWTNILKSNLWDLHMEGTNIIPALMLSYKYLPSYLKRCFAYCSIFPKGYLFEKDQLVLLWMAEGFLQQSEIETMEEVGNRYFDALVLRSLFQQSKIEIVEEEDGTRVSKSGFVMHNLFNVLANFVTRQFSFTRLEDGSKEIGKITRYALYFDGGLDNSKEIKEHLYKAKKLRTFLTLNSPNRWYWCGIKMLGATYLRTLSLAGYRGMICSNKLLESISKAKHLRYVDLSSSYFERLPDSICNLCNLQTLKLSRCHYLKRLPRDMWKLINLRHLEIDETIRLKEMPKKMGSLNCLQTLSKFIIGKHDNGCSIIELGKLRNLRGKLLILQKLQNVRFAKDALDAKLKDKCYLKELVLQWSPPEVLEEALDILEHQRGVLENLQPHKNLERLTIKYYHGKDFPDWIGRELLSLSKLKLVDCKNCSSLPPLGHLPFLDELHIDGLDGVVIVGPEFYGNSNNSSMKPFGSLEFLMLENMSNWENWFHLDAENEVEIFSQLKELHIINCPKLRGRLPVLLHSLAELEIIECQHLEDTLESLALSVQQRNDRITDFSYCLQEQRIRDCKKLELPMHCQYSSLEVLLLTNCCDSLTSISLDLFPNLKHIRIDGCNNLNSLKQHGDHLVISSIGIDECPKFVDFPEGGLRARNLASFQLCSCERLRLMPREMQLFLPSLSYLMLENCPEVESFPEGGLPSNLKHIVINNCKKLIENRKEWGLQTLPSLEWLGIGGGKSEDNVESFPGELLLPTTLTNLNIYSFGKLKSLDKEGFQHLTSLVRLDIIDCLNLKYMPEKGFTTSLRLLKIEDCPGLKKLKRKEGKEWLKVASVPNIYVGRRASSWAAAYTQVCSRIPSYLEKGSNKWLKLEVEAIQTVNRWIYFTTQKRDARWIYVRIQGDDDDRWQDSISPYIPPFVYSLEDRKWSFYEAFPRLIDAVDEDDVVESPSWWWSPDPRQ